MKMELLISKGHYMQIMKTGETEYCHLQEKHIWHSEDVKDGISRLMDAVNVDIDGDKITYNSTSFEQARDLKAKIIQWVPVEDNVNVSIVMDDASTKTGLGEGALKDLKVGDVVQFERVGFARLDEIKDNELVFYYAHK